MNNKIYLFILLVSLSCLSYAQGTSDFYNVKVLKVLDGDTLKVNLSCNVNVLCNQMSVRVRGVDTAEMKGQSPCEQKMAQKAKEFTQNFLKGGQVDLLACERDKYFRLLCNVKVNENNLSESLIKNNLAVAYDGGHKENVNWCGKINKNNEKKKVTIWQQLGKQIMALLKEGLEFLLSKIK